MKTIKLDENYRIECDTYNYTLIQEEVTDKINKKTGKFEVTNNQWYYPFLKDALNKYKEQSLKTTGSLDKVLYKLEEIELKLETIK